MANDLWESFEHLRDSKTDMNVHVNKIEEITSSEWRHTNLTKISCHSYQFLTINFESLNVRTDTFASNI